MWTTRLGRISLAPQLGEMMTRLRFLLCLPETVTDKETRRLLLQEHRP